MARLHGRPKCADTAVMKWHGLLIIGMALTGCDPVVSAGGTEGESSSGPEATVTSFDPDADPPMPTTTPPNPTTGIDPSTSSSTTTTTTTDADESSSSGEFTSSSSTGWAESSTGGSSTSGAESSGNPTGAVFLDPTGDPGDECDPYLQDCPDGEKCNAYASFGGSWDSLGCFPLDPTPGLPGEACTVEGAGTSGIDSCAAGAMCWDVDTETMEGECIAMCEGSADMPTCSDPSTNCVISNEGSLNLCLPICDPVLQDCPSGQACYPIDDTFVCAPDASGDDQGAAGDPCEYINACDPGLGCVEPSAYGPGCPAGASGCCSPFCDTALPNTCPEGGQECLPWFEEGAAPPGFDTVGSCAVPA